MAQFRLKRINPNLNSAAAVLDKCNQPTGLTGILYQSD